MSIYSDKLAHVQVIINCRYSVAQMCTSEDTLAHILGALFIDDMRYNTLITIFLFRFKRSDFDLEGHFETEKYREQEIFAKSSSFKTQNRQWSGVASDSLATKSHLRKQKKLHTGN